MSIHYFRKSTVAKGPELLTNQVTGKSGWRGARRKLIKPKMDLAKALGMMGFGSARIEGPSGKTNALDELNIALSRQMESLEERKKKIEKTEKVEQRREAQQDKLRDEIRTMHEAYQFLAQKYSNDRARMTDKASEKNEKEENNDDVFAIGAMGALLSTQSTVSPFASISSIDPVPCKDEVKDETVVSGSNLEQVS